MAFSGQVQMVPGGGMEIPRKHDKEHAARAQYTAAFLKNLAQILDVLESFKGEDGVKGFGGKRHGLADANDILSIDALRSGKISCSLDTDFAHFEPGELLKTITLIPSCVSSARKTAQIKDLG